MEKSQRSGGRARWMVIVLVAVVVSMFGEVNRLGGQSFPSGSTGSDGALTIAANQGTIIFDPADSARWGRVLDPDGDGVYHFTTISIGGGTTLRIGGDKVNKPVHFLATGDIVLSGTLDLNGENGKQTTDLIVRRQIAIPGAGGYAGGAGGRTSAPPATPGEGPGGGSGGITSGGCNTVEICGRGGTFTGNRYLVPLIGGSGGEGARWSDAIFRSGGAGGGAILLASSTSISVTGAINATGGRGASVAGGGSGGAIRLVAPVITGGGSLFVNGGTSDHGSSVGASGWVRLEGFQISGSLLIGPNSQFLTKGSPVDPSTLKPSGSVRILTIAGFAVPVYPSGSFALPDVTINSATPVNVDIEGTGIPPGTVVTLRVFPDTPEDNATIYLPAVQATLEGTTERTTATVSFSFPYGFSRGHVRASWTQ